MQVKGKDRRVFCQTRCGIQALPTKNHGIRPRRLYLCIMKPVLHNIYDRETLRRKLAEEPFDRLTISFYKYTPIEDPVAFRNQLFESWQAMGVLGRTYVAHEGINAQISVPEPAFETFKAALYAIPFLNGIRLNIAVESKDEAFLKLIIRIREKIVADGIDDPAFDVTQCGPHLDAASFNAMLDRPDAVVVDMRNHYESEVGHFEGAIRPDVDTFRESLPIVENMLSEHKDKPVLLYCTGGIRCEKASAYLKHKGFSQVYQLEGGIIEYTRNAKAQNLPIRFIGKNFVFDDRLGERITEDVIAHCHQCGAPCDTHTNCVNARCHLLFIQCATCAETYHGCCSEVCAEEIQLPVEVQKTLRKGTNKGANIFKKGRFPRPQDVQGFHPDHIGQNSLNRI